MKTPLRVLGIAVGTVVALLVGLVLYLSFGDLGRHKGRIEAFVSQQIDRPFAIDGPFTLRLVPRISLQAEQIRIGNPGWSSTPQMLQAGRFATQVDLLSLFSGPVVVRSLELSDVTVVLERNSKGEDNWTFGDPEAPAAQPTAEDAGFRKLPIAFEHVALSNLHLTHRVAGQQDRQVQIDSLTVHPGSGDLLSLVGKGSVDEYAATLAGELGPLDALISGRDIRMSIQASLGNLQVVAKGAVGQLHPLDGADLQLTVDNPDFGNMLRKLQLPQFAEGPIHLEASLKDAGERTKVALRTKADDLTVTLDGTLAALGLRDLDLDFTFEALDAARLATLFNIKGVPAEKLEAAGKVALSPTKRQRDGNSLRLAVKASLGDLRVDAKGAIAQLEPLQGADVKLVIDDPDTGALLRNLQLPAVAEGPLHVDASLSTAGKRTQVQFQATAGDISANVSGSLAALGWRDSDLDFTFDVPDAARLATLFDIKGVPAGKLEAAGNVAFSQAKRRRDGTGVRLAVKASLGELHVDAKGAIAQLEPLQGADVKLLIDDPDTGTLLRNLQLPAVAEGPLHVDASLNTAGKRTQVQFQATAGDISANISGSLAALGLRDADLQFQAGARDAARLATAFDLDGVPATPVEVAGHLAATGMDLKFSDVSAKLGRTQAHFNGTIPENREQAITLRFDISAASLAELKADLPDIPLKASGDMTHAPERIELAQLVAQVGKTDLQGKALIQGGPHRRVEADLSSPLIDLTPWLKKPAPAVQTAAPAPASSRRYVFPDSALPLAGLQGLDARVHFNVGELRADKVLLKDIDARISANDGRLQAKAHARGGYGGSLDGSADVATSGSNAAVVKVDLTMQDLRAGLTGGDAVGPEEVPPMSLVADLSATGASPRQLVSGANGSLLFSLGRGRARSGVLAVVGSGVFGQLLNRLNPFAKEDQFTVVDCSVMRLDIRDGKTLVAPVLLQTGKVTIIAHGSIHMDTEVLELNFNTRPRKGIGVSPGMFTNPFLELRGTLASPTIGVGAKGMTSGALAAATGGASVLAMGVLDRVKGEADLCAATLLAAQHPADGKGE